MNYIMYKFIITSSKWLKMIVRPTTRIAGIVCWTLREPLRGSGALQLGNSLVKSHLKFSFCAIVLGTFNNKFKLPNN